MRTACRSLSKRRDMDRDTPWENEVRKPLDGNGEQSLYRRCTKGFRTDRGSELSAWIRVSRRWQRRRLAWHASCMYICNSSRSSGAEG